MMKRFIGLIIVMGLFFNISASVELLEGYTKVVNTAADKSNNDVSRFLLNNDIKQLCQRVPSFGPPLPPPAPKKPIVVGAAGGGRAGLLAEIQKGKALKKVEPQEQQEEHKQPPKGGVGLGISQEAIAGARLSAKPRPSGQVKSISRNEEREIVILQNINKSKEENNNESYNRALEEALDYIISGKDSDPRFFDIAAADFKKLIQTEFAALDIIPVKLRAKRARAGI